MIPHNRPTLGEEEIEAATRVIKSGWIAQGNEVKEFENEFCNFMGLEEGHAVSVSSGSAALFLALNSLDSEKKNVYYPVYSCAALRNAILLANGNENPRDVTNDFPTMTLSGDITDNSIGIIAHMFGIPTKIEDFKCDIIEDCAQAIGAKIDGNYVGLQGKIGIFSFYATKMITSGGQGGMIISKDKEIIEKIKDYREFDMRKDLKNRFNFQLTDIQAAIGRVQLSKLPVFIKKREEIFQRYKNEINEEFLDTSLDNILPVRYRAIIITNNPQNMIKKLKNQGITAVIPVEEEEMLTLDYEKFPNAKKLSQQFVSIPIFPSITDEEVELIIKTVNAN